MKYWRLEIRGRCPLSPVESRPVMRYDYCYKEHDNDKELFYLLAHYTAPTLLGHIVRPGLDG